ncbi:MAG TPA: exonuclease domain-containing protein, partial [Trueperaceae bacterium]|nr:exonuclease domain-containing protein [Trueperaceae bacterium]
MRDRDNPIQPGLFQVDVEEPTTYELDELEHMRLALERSGHYKVLTQFRRRSRYAEPSAESRGPLRRGVFLDVETTGLDASDKIIELALVSFEFDDAGTVYRVLEEFDEFEDPGRTISQEITDLTGITAEDVRGKR